jgi:hypothetical protein
MHKAGRSKLLSKRRSQRGASEIAQFIPVFYILFVLVFLPLMNIALLFVGAATQYLITNDFAYKASTQSDYPSALNAMVTESYNFAASGLSKFMHILPQGGYASCGDDLYIVVTNIASGAVTISGADLPLTQPVDTTKNMYEMRVTSSYVISPMFNMSAIPLIGSIPGLGQPVNFTFNANRPAEHPAGLQPVSSNGSGSTSSAGGKPFIRTTTAGQPTSSTWRDPSIYSQIQAAGQSIISENVVLVQANNPNWTPTGLTINPGDSVYIDTQAVGQWNCGLPNYQWLDANGYGSLSGSSSTCPNCPGASLDGKIGATGTPFFLGNEKLNYPPPSSNSGTFSMVFNDLVGEFNDNQGAQEVRVIIVR